MLDSDSQSVYSNNRKSRSRYNNYNASYSKFRNMVSRTNAFEITNQIDKPSTIIKLPYSNNDSNIKTFKIEEEIQRNYGSNYNSYKNEHILQELEDSNKANPRNIDNKIMQKNCLDRNFDIPKGYEQYSNFGEMDDKTSDKQNRGTKKINNLFDDEGSLVHYSNPNWGNDRNFNTEKNHNFDYDLNSERNINEFDKRAFSQDLDYAKKNDNMRLKNDNSSYGFFNFANHEDQTNYNGPSNQARKNIDKSFKSFNDKFSKAKNWQESFNKGLTNNELNADNLFIPENVDDSKTTEIELLTLKIKELESKLNEIQNKSIEHSDCASCDLNKTFEEEYDKGNFLIKHKYIKNSSLKNSLNVSSTPKFENHKSKEYDSSSLKNIDNNYQNIGFYNQFPSSPSNLNSLTQQRNQIGYQLLERDSDTRLYDNNKFYEKDNSNNTQTKNPSNYIKKGYEDVNVLDYYQKNTNKHMGNNPNNKFNHDPLYNSQDEVAKRYPRNSIISKYEEDGQIITKIKKPLKLIKSYTDFDSVNLHKRVEKSQNINSNNLLSSNEYQFQNISNFHVLRDSENIEKTLPSNLKNENFRTNDNFINQRSSVTYIKNSGSDKKQILGFSNIKDSTTSYYNQNNSNDNELRESLSYNNFRDSSIHPNNFNQRTSNLYSHLNIHNNETYLKPNFKATSRTNTDFNPIIEKYKEPKDYQFNSKIQNNERSDYKGYYQNELILNNSGNSKSNKESGNCNIYAHSKQYNFDDYQDNQINHSKGSALNPDKINLNSQIDPNPYRYSNYQNKDNSPYRSNVINYSESEDLERNYQNNIKEINLIDQSNEVKDLPNRKRKSGGENKYELSFGNYNNDNKSKTNLKIEPFSFKNVENFRLNLGKQNENSSEIKIEILDEENDNFWNN